ncbi:MAG: GTPase-associated system all-helical protein GASH [Pseudomonadota bacterium]
MSKVALHMRIANLNVTNEEVVSRMEAVTSLATAWLQLDDLDLLIAKANEIAVALNGDGTPSAALAAEIEAAIQKQAPAYVYSERPLDVSICAGVAALNVVTFDEPPEKVTRDIFAAILWSALAYQPALEDARREALRVELLDACRKQCADAAESAREREDVEEFNDLTSDDEEEEAEVDLEEVKRVAASAISSLNRNAVLDREELNFLWWAQLNRSRLLKKPLAGIPEPVRLVACAIEGAQYLTALPAEVHRDLVLRTLDADPNLNHEAMLKKFGTDREALNGVFGEIEIVKRFPTAFPLLHSLRTGEASEDGAKVVRSSSEWASRALLEGAIVRLYLSELVES